MAYANTLPLAASAILLLTAASLARAGGMWADTGRMACGRWAPVAAVLPNGKVLVAGGYDGTTTVASAQLYDPATGMFSDTGAMTVGRNFAAATLLDSGKLLVTGGFNETTGTLKDAQLYDPASGTFRLVPGTMERGRELFTATKLPGGKVLMAGGFATGRGGGTLRSAELYDPATESFAPTGSLTSPYGRFGHAAVYLPTLNKVLIVGGKERRSAMDWRALDTVELYDLETGTFTEAGTLAFRRDRPSVAWIGSAKKALIIGGKSEAPGAPSEDVLSCEWFDPATGGLSKGPSLAVGRMAQEQAVLPDGSVLVAGGWNCSLNRTTEAAERFIADPAEALGGRWVPAGKMRDSRHDGGTVLLPNGRVLVAGGKQVDQNPGGATTYPDRAETFTLP